MSGSRLLTLMVAFGLIAVGGKKDEAAPYAIVGGTVFRDPGFALPGVNVTLTLRGDPKAKKLQHAVTTARGEFAFRVPPTAATYLVKASLKGFQPQEKEASVSGEEHIDVTLTLAPESK